MAAERYQHLHVETRSGWRAWLAEHHATVRGAWLISWKKATGRPAMGYDASVEEALCVGWVDSLGRKLDEERSMLLFTPRKPSSRWSRPNKERIERLTAAGLMRPAGLAVVEHARATGGWTALDEVEDLMVPPDLAAALDARPGAREAWDGFPRSVRRGILEWILAARRADTRARRVEETASEAAEGRRANQWRGRRPG